MPDVRAYAKTIFDRTALVTKYAAVTVTYSPGGPNASGGQVFLVRQANFQPFRSDLIDATDGMDDVETADFRISKDFVLGIVAPTVDDTLTIDTPALGTWEVIDTPEDEGPSWRMTITKMDARHRSRQGYTLQRSQG